MDKNRTYLITLILLLIGSVFALLYSNRRNTDMNEPYRNAYSNKKILVITTENALDNKSRDFKKMKQHEIVTYEKLINTDIEDWNRIVQDITQNYNNYDGFLIKCEDTNGITYLATALSFMLENIEKTVVITCEKDCRHLLKVISKYLIPEVCIYTDKKLLRACCCTTVLDKVHSLHHLPIFNKKLINKNILQYPTENFKPMLINWKNKIVIIKLQPGIDGDHLKRMIEGENVYGIILENYGNGQLLLSQDFMNTVHNLTKKGIVVVQTSMDKINISENVLDSLGVVSGNKQTTETVFAKLSIIYSNLENPKPSLVKQLIDVNMRGEMG